MNIVFVCTGNTCRSPMAEAIFKSKTHNFADTCSIMSCGLSVMPGDTASENAIKVMSERGIDISTHRSRPLSYEIIENADYIICLAKSHYNAVFPYAKSKTVLLGSGISDPFMGDIDVYSHCADEIETAIDDLLSSDLFYSMEKMTSDDEKRLSEIENKCFSDPWSENAFADEAEKSYGVNFVCRYLGKIVGYIFADDICNEVTISNVAASPDFRKRGVGNKLMNAIDDYCKLNKSNLITLEVRQSNEPAINLYKKHGFEIIGKRKDFYSKPKEDAYIMTKYYGGETNENTCN